MRVVMILPAKGFSRRIPGKNLKPFCGVPLVEWSIVQAMKSRLLDDLWVTTDDEEIGAITEKHGGHVMYRRYKDDDMTNGTVPVRRCAERLVYEDKVLDLDDMVLVRLCTTPHFLPDDLDNFIMHAIKVFGEGYIHLGNGANVRQRAVSRAIIPGLMVSVGNEWRMGDEYATVIHLAFIGAMRARQLIEPPAPKRKTRGVSEYHQFHDWQMQDVDTPEEWEFGELVMEHYILQGKGVEVYG